MCSNLILVIKHGVGHQDQSHCMTTHVQLTIKHYYYKMTIIIVIKNERYSLIASFQDEAKSKHQLYFCGARLVIG